MLPSADPPSPRILPLRVLVTLLAACLGGSWVMVPKRGELIDRLFKDKQYERVVAVLQDDVHRMAAADTNSLRRLDVGQLTVLERLLNLTPREQLRAIFAPKNAPAYDTHIHNIVLAAVRFVDVLPPQEVFELISPSIVRVPEEMRVQLLSSVAHNANAVGRPDLAASALHLACQCDTADWTLAQSMALSYRWSGKPAEAVQQLNRWLSVHLKDLPTSQRAEARQLCLALALESGNPGGAFDVCILDLQDIAAGSPIPSSLMETSVSLALQSGRTKELIPWLARFVNAMPEAKMNLADLHQESAKDTTRFAEYRRWAKPLAQWSDWTGQFDTAFDHHLRLAALGDAESRDRCLEIYDYLGRTEECCELLLALGEVKEKPELALTVATQLAELGRDDEAKPRFEAWMRAHPRDREARFDYACLLEDMGDDAAARTAFEEMVRLFPGDVPAMKRLAAACIRDSDYAAALDIYRKMPARDHDAETLENYAMIADSLDDHAAEYQALRLTAERGGSPTTELYLNMAEAASYLPDEQTVLNVLHEGLVKIPNSAQLRFALANQHLHAGRLDDALAALTHESLKDSFEGTQAILGMCESISDARRALAFLGDDVEQRFPLTPSNRLELAVLYFNAGQPTEAERLIASVKEGPDTNKAIAETRFHIADYANAARVMTTYLGENPKATANDWLFLGDIYELLGEFEQARKAYDHSLALLTAELPKTAAN